MFLRCTKTEDPCLAKKEVTHCVARCMHAVWHGCKSSGPKLKDNYKPCDVKKSVHVNFAGCSPMRLLSL